MGLGVGNRLFYSPLSWFTVALFGVILNIFNISIEVALKIIIVLMVFVSGVFMYRFALHFTDNNKTASIVSSACFVIYPYRLFDIFRRFALAEFFAITFLPLFFMGLYDIFHFKEKVNVMAFVEVVLGGALLILSHNITALYSFIFGIIFILVNIKSLIKSLKIKYYILLCIVSVILLIGISSISLFSQIELLKTKLYNVSDKNRMQASLSQVISSLKNWGFSGFSFSSKLKTFAKIVLSLFFCFSVIVIDNFLLKFKNKFFKKFHYLILFVIVFLGSVLFLNVLFVLSVLVFYFLFVYISSVVKKLKNTDKNEIVFNEKNIIKDLLFWFSVVSIIGIVILISFAFPWKLFPKILFNIQFAWRLWAFAQLFISVLMGLVCYYFNKKQIISYVCCTVVSMFMFFNYALTMIYGVYVSSDSSRYFCSEFNKSSFNYVYSLGSCKEYTPQVFADDYTSKYSNSLYYGIKEQLKKVDHNISDDEYGEIWYYETFDYEKYYYNPVVLTGNADIEIVKRKTPYYLMNVTATEKTKIQMPLFYYPGYSVKIKNTVTNKTQTLTPDNVDGLISFDIEQGTYKITVNYKGTTLRRTSKVLTITCSGVVIGYLIYNFVYKITKKKKILNDNTLIKT